MSECCGQIRKTPFCPMCGKTAVGTDLAELRAYLATQVRAAERQWKKAKRRVDESDAWSADEKNDNRFTRSIDRWKRRLAVLDEAIKP